MKVKTILGVIIGLTLVFSLSLPAAAGKPTPVANVGSITYVYDGSWHTITLGNITWQYTHPQGYQLRLYSDYDDYRATAYAWGGLPKGTAAKYPQNDSHTWGFIAPATYFTAGKNITVELHLVKKNGSVAADTGVVANITWGTNSTWTAP